MTAGLNLMSSPYSITLLPPPFIHSFTSIHPSWAEAEWISAIKLTWCIAGHSWNLQKGSPLLTSQTRAYSIKNHSTAHSRRSCLSYARSTQHTHHKLNMCVLLLCTIFKEKQSRPVSSLKAQGEIRMQLERTRWRTQTLKGGIPDMGSLATEIPSFYLSAALRPVGTDRRARTGRHHSRTLASSRTSRVEAERSLPPAGRRLTGRRRRPSAGVFN